ncbi:hypothetical protein NQ293_25290, partial [Escherichia coli]|nr:hypothetical protein [Escherichia coli]
LSHQNYGILLRDGTSIVTASNHDLKGPLHELQCIDEGCLRRSAAHRGSVGTVSRAGCRP